MTETNGVNDYARNRLHRLGGNNRSTKSGSSCWPPCSVGQDPNSPDPENARSLLKKKKADKNTEEKSVAVVRSQPLKARHVMTDNTESTKYSAENEKFSAGLDKGQTPRPLPSIGQPIDSPRPLPQMPRSTQQEKGGIQLQPLGDSTSEKKKKKRRKKKEIKNSDEED
ncbi:unnamed protein product [Mytilus coruscus]|uniref:Uncharacterized protein n=1 Tax=Mytilus coruscus TaxID=42192 RepID=A0A6J8AAS5_MYTCO|nr:unnamed protein product [Mytilus coruscus]